MEKITIPSQEIPILSHVDVLVLGAGPAGVSAAVCAARQGAKTLSLPMQMLGVDLQAGRVVYNNNPILKWCLTNTGIQTDRNGNIVPVKNQSPKQRIDGTASLLNAYVGLYEHYSEYTGAL